MLANIKKAAYGVSDCKVELRELCNVVSKGVPLVCIYALAGVSNIVAYSCGNEPRVAYRCL